MKTNIKPQYNKNKLRRFREICSFWIAIIFGEMALIIKLNANKDPTNKKLVQNNFREIFLCCLEKICWINQIQKYHSNIHTIIAQATFISFIHNKHYYSLYRIFLYKLFKLGNLAWIYWGNVYYLPCFMMVWRA